MRKELDQEEIDAWKLDGWFRGLGEGEVVVVRYLWAYHNKDGTVDHNEVLRLARVVTRKEERGHFAGISFPMIKIKFKFVGSRHVFWSKSTLCDEYCYYIEPLNFTNWKDREADTKELLTRHFLPGIIKA